MEPIKKTDEVIESLCEKNLSTMQPSEMLLHDPEEQKAYMKWLYQKMLPEEFDDMDTLKSEMACLHGEKLKEFWKDTGYDMFPEHLSSPFTRAGFPRQSKDAEALAIFQLAVEKIYLEQFHSGDKLCEEDAERLYHSYKSKEIHLSPLIEHCADSLSAYTVAEALYRLENIESEAYEKGLQHGYQTKSKARNTGR